MNAIRENAMRSETEVMMPRSTLAAAAAALLVILLTACGVPVPGVETAGPKGTDSHAALSSGLACTGTGAHTVHLNTFACDVCHEANGGRFLFTKVFTFPKGTSTAGGTIAPGTATTPTGCTVACHYPMGAAQRTITWDTPGPLACTACHDTGLLPAYHPVVAANAPRGDCVACHTMTGHMDGVVLATAHGAPWMDRTSAGFHASSANQGLAACQGCHGAALAGKGSAPSCASCHDKALPAGVAGWSTNCVMCHGGTDDQSGAPPKATWGNAADAVRVGAHAAHSKGGALAPAYDCGVCHAKPADAFAAGHIDPGPAEVSFSGMAVRALTPSWDRITGTCTNVYCHGASVAGGSNKAPSWTGGGSEASCGTCHGAPPPAPHPAAGDLASCAACHPDTVAADGTVIAPASGGKHLDGVLQAVGGHPAAWSDRASPGFHAYGANESLAACQSCHGVALDGVGGSATTSCASCHGAGWTTRCTMCHGGDVDTTGAPPRATWGHAADPLRVGAHVRHLTGGASTPAVACATCHQVPADALAAGHVDGDPEVVMTGIAAAGNATPSWDRATGACATTYCHGGYTGVFTWQSYDWNSDSYIQNTWAYSGSGAAPSWSGGPTSCGSCHGAPPSGHWHSPTHGGNQTGCDLCHPGVDTAGTGFGDASRHVDGTVDVTPRWSARCNKCH